MFAKSPLVLLSVVAADALAASPARLVNPLQPGPFAAASDVEEAAVAAPASPAAPTTAPAGPSKRVALTEAEAAELKAFDLTMAFGPMVGLTRLERWERAQEAGLGPPAHLHALLLVLDEQSRGAQSVWGQSPLFKIPAPPPTM